MEFHNHSNLLNEHSFLSASKYHWINYDIDRLIESYSKYRAAKQGTEDHAFAALCIERGQKLPKSNKTLNLYVNDAIGFKMTPEQVLYYSDNAFGTADAISFRNNILRIHDLKTGESPTSFHQLEIYDAYFCLEYKVKPSDIRIENRIYQLNEVAIEEPDPEFIFSIMEKIIEFDKVITKIKAEGA